MFTGLVDHCGTVESADRSSGSLSIRICSSFTDIKVGESVAVDGACLSVVKNDKGTFLCEVSAETEALTVASQYVVGQKVNLERALRLGDRLSGHWVTGHVDTRLTVSEVENRGEFLFLRVNGVASQDRPFVARKGSVAVNGVSLTVNEVGEAHFTVLLVPHTLEHTNLSRLSLGSAVNIEWDWMAKTVLEALQTRFPQRKDNESPNPIH